MATYKTCSSCARRLSVAKFGRNLSAPDGLSWYCRECANEKQREWKAANPKKVRKWQEDYRRRNREKNAGE